MWNRKLSITICIIFITNIILNSQSINIGFGPIYTLTNQSTRMINSTDDFQNTASQSKITYEQYFRGRKYSIFSSLSKFEGHTWIKFSNGSVVTKDGLPTLGVGYSGVDLFRLDFGLSYNLINKFKNIILSLKLQLVFLSRLVMVKIFIVN